MKPMNPHVLLYDWKIRGVFDFSLYSVSVYRNTYTYIYIYTYIPTAFEMLKPPKDDFDRNNLFWDVPKHQLPGFLDISGIGNPFL